MNINFKSPDHNNAKNLEQLKGEYTLTHTRHAMILQGHSAAATCSVLPAVPLFFLYSEF